MRLLIALLTLCFVVQAVRSACQDDGTDNFPDKVSVDLASGFTVEYHDYYKIVNNTRANEVYVLYCTATQPNVTSLPANVKSFIQLPVQNVASLYLPVASFLEILGVGSSLKSVSSPANVTSPCLQKANLTTFVENSTDSIDVVFANTPGNSNSKYVTVSLGDDLSPLQEAEWIKFVALFYNAERIATSAFRSKELNYYCNSANLANVPDSKKKIVAWVSYDAAENSWHVRNDAYVSQLTKDSGAVLPPISNNTFVSLSDFQSAVSGAFLVIDQTPNDDSLEAWQKLFGYYDSQGSGASLPSFIQYKRVYRTDKLKNELGFDDWSETSMARPDLVLRDVISVQYPTYERSYQPTWLENFSKLDAFIILTPANCTDPASSSNKDPALMNVATCQLYNFTGDSEPSNNGPPNNDGSNGDHKRIVIFSVLGAALVLALGFAAIFYARKKYRAKFIDMKDVQLTENNGEIKVIPNKEQK